MTYKRHKDRSHKLDLQIKYFFSFTDRWIEFINWCSDQVFAKFEGALEKKWGPVTEMTFYKGW